MAAPTEMDARVDVPTAVAPELTVKAGFVPVPVAVAVTDTTKPQDAPFVKVDPGEDAKVNVVEVNDAV